MKSSNYLPRAGAAVLFALTVLPATARADHHEGGNSEAKNEETESIFPDKNLERAVRKMVYAKRNSDEPLTVSDVGNISILKGSSLGIKSLEGLQHCTMLASLVLPGNDIADLSPLANLKMLQKIDVSDNRVQDLSPLAGLERLQYLNAEGNEIDSVKPLRKLESLTSLYMSGNRVADLTPIFGLSKLWSIYFNNNQLTDLSGITQLSRVDTFGLAGNQIEDLTPLAGTVPRNALYLSDNKIQNLEPLLEMFRKDLEGEKRFAPYARIYLSGNPLDDQGRRQLETMKELGLRVTYQSE